LKFKTEKSWPFFPISFNNDRFEIKELIASGGYAYVFIGWDHFLRSEIAIKIPNLSKIRASRILKKEKNYLRELYDSGVTVPKVLWFGKCFDRLVLVMNLLGTSLGEIKKRSNRNFSTSTIFLLGIELIVLCQKVHECGILHRDCKLKNYVLGLKDSQIYIIDFGLSGRWKSKKNELHIPAKKYLLPYGTIRYAPLAVHIGNEQGRKEDLEAICYLLIYLMRGNLPWQFFSSKNKKILWNNVGKIKLEIPLTELCSSVCFCFRELLSGVYSLKFHDEPSYMFFLTILTETMKSLNLRNNEFYDWECTRLNS